MSKQCDNVKMSEYLDAVTVVYCIIAGRIYYSKVHHVP